MTKTESIPLILMVFLTAAVVALSLFTYRQNTTLRQQEQHIQQLAKTLAADNERDAFELQERCAKHAEKAFGTLGQQGDFAVYASHYNAKLNRCFVTIETHDTKTARETMYINKTLMDAVEGFVYGDYASKSFDTVPFECTMRPFPNTKQVCKSEKEFDDFVANYMTDRR